MPYVNGSNKAMLIEGEIPGSAPPRIPPGDPGDRRQCERCGDQHVEAFKYCSHYPPHSAGQNPGGMSIPSTRSKKIQNATPPPAAIRARRQPARSP